jgi:hypothetical protein
MKDGMETDVDCGGPTCGPCANGQGCLVPGDCKSAQCVNNKCQGPINCMAPMANCDGNPMSGCNVNLDTDAKNCGKCGNVCPMNAPACSGGKCVANGKKVLLCYDDTNANGVMALKNELLKTFPIVDSVDCAKSTPDLPTLQKYNSVLVWGIDNGYADSDTLGTNLKQYVDGGGGVVVGQTNFNQPRPFMLGGTWASMAYNCLGACVNVSTLSLEAQPSEPNSPLITGVTSLTAMFAAWRIQNNLPIEHVPWRWMGTGDPAIVTCHRGGQQRVDLDFIPDPSYWQGDGYAIIRNALQFVGN